MVPPDWACPRRVGFLFPHPCDRTSPIGCPDCQNGQIADPYAHRPDRFGYNDYDDYSSVSMIGYGVDGVQDFTEADGAMLVKRRDDFEGDMSAS